MSCTLYSMTLHSCFGGPGGQRGGRSPVVSQSTGAESGIVVVLVSWLEQALSKLRQASNLFLDIDSLQRSNCGWSSNQNNKDDENTKSRAVPLSGPESDIGVVTLELSGQEQQSHKFENQSLDIDHGDQSDQHSAKVESFQNPHDNEEHKIDHNCNSVRNCSHDGTCLLAAQSKHWTCTARQSQTTKQDTNVNDNWSQRTNDQSQHRVNWFSINHTGLSVHKGVSNKTTSSVDHTWKSIREEDVGSMSSCSITSSLLGVITDDLSLETGHSRSGQSNVANPRVSVPFGVTSGQPSDEISVVNKSSLPMCNCSEQQHNHTSSTNVNGGVGKSGIQHREWNSSSRKTSSGGNVSSTTNANIVQQRRRVDLSDEHLKQWRKRQEMSTKSVRTLPHTSLDQFLNKQWNKGNEENNENRQCVTSNPVNGRHQLVTSQRILNIRNWLVSVVET
ncbi:hypothetical protein OGATHE_002793 [Ogataea polymorpha]|uniref:Uncharacterized protein n=1 Tax=Ogataea polymorpha TaxID=460523 RepID=A0A9P8T970_9ASCO|nr:hypothetical protein OGATHE_002793 [Ogataea polymorpha]